MRIETGDRELVQIVDTAMAEAARRSGSWLVCRPGCTQCCIGPFPITQLDALRLRAGLRALDAADAARAGRVRARVKSYLDLIAPCYPGSTVTGELWDEDGLPPSMDDLACP